MATPTKFGDEFLVNFNVDGDQDQSSLVGLKNGRFGAFFTSDVDRSGSDVFLRLFKTGGTPVSTDADISVFPRIRAQDQASGSVLSDGRIVLAFHDQDTTDTNDTSGSHIADLTRNQDGSQNRVPGLTNLTNKTGEQVTPTVAGLDNGRYVVVWGDEGGATRDLRARIFTNDGAPVGAEFTVQTNSAGGQITPSVAALAGGRFVVTWTDGSGTLGDASVNSVKAKIFDSDGSGVTVVKNEFLVNTTTANAQTDAVVTTLAGGGFVVAWTHDIAAGAGGDSDIRYRVFDAAGVAAANDLSVGQFVTNSQSAIAALADGRFVIAYTSDSGVAALGDRVFVSLFNADGSSSGSLKVNTTDTGDQSDPSITVLADGRFVVSWTDASQTGGDTSGTAIRAQIFDPREAGVTVDGTDGDDEYIGSAFGDTLNGLGGNDVLNGGAAADTLKGGAGDDLYFVNNAGDVIVEGVGQGTLDKVATNVSYTLGAGVQVETFTTTSANGTSEIDLTGNEFAQAIFGNAGANTINAKAGADTMTGGKGNDLYFVDNGGDVVVEGTGQGTLDKVATNVSYALGAGVQVETFNTTSANGTGALDLTGNEFAQTITGNAGANTLRGNGGNDVLNAGGGNDKFVGGLGADTMSGGLGSDVFIYAALNEVGDTLSDFSSNATGNNDVFKFDGSVFGGLPAGVIAANQFETNTGGLATAATTRFIFETDTRILHFDSNGSAGGGTILDIATLQAGATMTFDDIVIF